MNYAPIVLFVYNRPWHTKQTIEALQKNELAQESELIIYSDAAKNDESIDAVEEVREFIHNITGFKKITIIERDKNWGLADSIIDGVTLVVNQYGKIIVLEDDIVTSPYFLKYMNDALHYYQEKDNVMHISGWNYPINPSGLNDVFLWRVMNCWGWATWSDRWLYFEKNIEAIESGLNDNDIYRFNLEGTEDFYSQVIANKKNEINTWAIFWYASIFKQEGLCVNPSVTFVENIGHDGTGVHCGNIGVTPSIELNIKQKITFTPKLVESSGALTLIKQYYLRRKKSMLIRIVNKVSRLLLNRNLIQ